ncbi:MAG: hypothetical protein NZ108_10785, partial [Bacteroidia bacterium]|nr:hypothetical protein [Bacteroidia bacterium]
MNLLFQFLKVLPDEYRNQLSQLELSPTEHSVCKAMLNRLSEEELDKPKLLSDLSLTENHFFKVSSTILQKLYHAFFPSPIDLLENLARLHLPEHLKKAYEKITKTPQTSQFYQIALDCFLGMPLKDLDITLAQKVANSYLDSLSQVTPADLAFIRLRFITTEIYSILLPAKGKGETEFEKLRKQYENELLTLRQTEGIEQHTIAWYSWNRAYGLFNVQLSQEKEALSYLEICQKIANQPDTPLSKREIVRASCRLAEVYYYDNQPEIAWQEYAKIRLSHPTQFAWEAYHQTKFIQLSLILDKLSYAEELLQEYFPY